MKPCAGQMDKWCPSAVSRTGERYSLELLTPGQDGFIHDDDDFRTRCTASPAPPA